MFSSCGCVCVTVIKCAPGDRFAGGTKREAVLSIKGGHVQIRLWFNDF